MSVIKRLGNLAKGTLKTWSDDDGPHDLTDADRRAAEDELRRLEAEARVLDGKPAAPSVPRPTASPGDARREAIQQAYAAGVITLEERDGKLAEVKAEEDARARGVPPKPKKRTL
jgi:hypothetical protein